MIDNTKICREAISTGERSFMSLELDNIDTTDALYIPVIFSNDIISFFQYEKEEELIINDDNTIHFYKGGILLSSTRVILSLIISSLKNPNACSQDKFLNINSKGKEVVVFSDIIDTITGFREWISNISNNILCYELQLLGGAHCIIFRFDINRILSLPFSDNKKNNSLEGKKVEKEKEILPLWVHHVEEFIGQDIETFTISCKYFNEISINNGVNNTNNNNYYYYYYEEVKEIHKSTFYWNLLNVDAIRELNVLKCSSYSQKKKEEEDNIIFESCSPPILDKENIYSAEKVDNSEHSEKIERISKNNSIDNNNIVELEKYRQECFYEAFNTYISLINEEHLGREDILIQYTSLLVQKVITNYRKYNIANNSLSLRGKVAQKVENNQIDVKKDPDIVDEIIILLEEEEKIARIKLEKYMASTRHKNRVN